MSRWTTTYEGDGDAYDARFAKLAASGMAVHGEADHVEAMRPASVLDAGCGTGRVAIELRRRGIEAVGVDLDERMLATARAKDPAAPGCWPTCRRSTSLARSTSCWPPAT